LTLPAHQEFSAAWRHIRAELREAVGESYYELWIAPLEPDTWDGSVLTIRTAAATRSWLSDRFGAVIHRCAQDVLGRPVQVHFQTDEDRPESGAYSLSLQRDRPHPRRSPERRDPHQPLLELRDDFNPRYSFDQFVIGAGNRLAHGAALAVAELPGQAYNPLFLHAPPGLGKTHLLHAIGNYVLAYGGGASVRYTTTEAFTNNFIAAISTNSVDRFKRAYRDADVLLIDDVQFLASKAKTEEEFFHTFNAVHETGRQLVLTCDRLPSELLSLEERLRARFEAGLVAEIAPPDLQTRLTILRKRAALDHVPVTDDDVLCLIAERVTDNIRSLEGALIRIVANHSLTGRPIGVELAREVLDEIHPQPGATMRVVDIQAAVASHFGLTTAELTSTGRATRIAWPRQLAMFLARELTHTSLPAIGQAFGGKDHATVHYACRRVAERARNDPEVATMISTLRESISTGPRGDSPGARQATTPDHSDRRD
jgi:chromosomal replication initiator protein